MNILVILAKTEAGLVAAAENARAVILNKQKFETLGTYDQTPLSSGEIDVTAPGWIALARRED